MEYLEYVRDTDCVLRGTLVLQIPGELLPWVESDAGSVIDGDTGQ